MPELIPSPHEPSKGMSADEAQKFLALSISQQSGKSIDDVLAFLKGQGGSPAAAQSTTPQPAPVLPEALAEAKLPLPQETVEEEVIEEVVVAPTPKTKAPLKVTKADNGMDEVITETLSDDEADDETLEKLNEEEFEEFDGKIRMGSKVKVVYDPPGGRIKWMGRKGTVTRIIGNERAKVFEIEFPKGKFPFTRRNKKTGKIEKGYQIKKIKNTFDAENIELAD